LLYNDSLKFENKEQIEVSKFMKNCQPHALAVQEWLDGKIYYRDSTKYNVSFSGKKVLLGISGGIAAYKTAS
jgi:hypothetical protein